MIKASAFTQPVHILSYSSYGTTRFIVARSLKSLANTVRKYPRRHIGDLGEYWTGTVVDLPHAHVEKVCKDRMAEESIEFAQELREILRSNITRKHLPPDVTICSCMEDLNIYNRWDWKHIHRWDNACPLCHEAGMLLKGKKLTEIYSEFTKPEDLKDIPIVTTYKIAKRIFTIGNDARHNNNSVIAPLPKVKDFEYRKGTISLAFTGERKDIPDEVRKAYNDSVEEQYRKDMARNEDQKKIKFERNLISYTLILTNAGYPTDIATIMAEDAAKQ